MSSAKPPTYERMIRLCAITTWLLFIVGILAGVVEGSVTGIVVSLGGLSLMALLHFVKNEIALMLTAYHEGLEFGLSDRTESRSG